MYIYLWPLSNLLSFLSLFGVQYLSAFDALFNCLLYVLTEFSPSFSHLIFSSVRFASQNLSFCESKIILTSIGCLTNFFRTSSLLLSKRLCKSLFWYNFRYYRCTHIWKNNVMCIWRSFPSLVTRIHLLHIWIYVGRNEEWNLVEAKRICLLFLLLFKPLLMQWKQF